MSGAIIIVISGLASMSSVLGSAIGGVLYNSKLDSNDNSEQDSNDSDPEPASPAAPSEPAPSEPAPPSSAPEPVDCVGSWSQEPCSVQCGGGTKTKIWTTSVEPQHGGNPCPSPKTKVLPCNSQSCAAAVQPPAGVSS
jgi:hypothetical protein